MMLSKRKKLLLEKNNRLAPIEEVQLKVKPKRNHSERHAQENNVPNIKSMPDFQKASKSKRPMDIPAIDHTKQINKLQEMMQTNDIGMGNIQSQSLTAFPNNFKQQQVQQMALSKIPQTMSFSNEQRNQIVSDTDKKMMMLKRKKLHSHQQQKPGTNNEEQKDEQVIIIKNRKGLPPQRRQKQIQNQETQESTGGESSKPHTANAVQKGESKWMREIIRQQYKRMIDKFLSYEAKRRVNILRSVRGQLRQRFMKVFRLYRHKKYGEPIDPPKPLPSENSPDKSDLSGEIDEIKNRRMNQEEKELNTVIEEEESIPESESSVLHNEEEVQEYIYDIVEGDFIYDMILIQADQVMKVKNFLSFCIQRNRYLKLKKSTHKLQPILKGFLARKKVKQMRQEKLDEENVKKMEQQIKKGDQERLNEAAIKIQNLYIRQIKKKRQGRELREQMKKLPYEVRRTVIKMQELKANTNMLRQTFTNKFGK